LALVKEISSKIEIVDYMNITMSRKELQNLLVQLDMKPSELLRKGESDYKEHIKGKNLSDEEIIDLMLLYPKLIERPIIVRNEKAIVARPPELVHSFLK
jgi:arsenate reductase